MSARTGPEENNQNPLPVFVGRGVPSLLSAPCPQSPPSVSSFSSISSTNSNSIDGDEQQQHQQLGAISFSSSSVGLPLLPKTSPASTVVHDYGSSHDDDSDAHSILSPPESMELFSLGEGRARESSVIVVGHDLGRIDSPSHDSFDDVQTIESAGHKRTLSEDSSKLGRQRQQQLRKACDLCTKRKRKCNGQHPCSQCLETGVENQCIYSPRLKSGRKKKVRIDGVLYDEVGGVYDGTGLALLANGGTRRGAGASGYTVDTAAGRFSASGAVGLVGHVENFFLATYLRDFNRFVPLTSESSVTEGMLEVLSPAISSRGLSAASPIKQPEPRRQAKLAVFWGVVAMGSRILGSNDESTARYVELMRSALKECFSSNHKEVIQAYLLLSTIETMRGNEEVGMRYFDHARAIHNGNAIGPDGKVLKGRPEREESLDVVFKIYGQAKTCSGESGDHQHGHGSQHKVVREQNASSALDDMISQVMSPASDAHQSGPLKALKYLSNVCGLSSEVFDPTHKCVTVKQYLGEMDTALKGADTLFKDTDLSECITGVVMVKIWGGITIVMRSWGKADEKDEGLSQVEEGVGYALTRPGLMTFPMWWHALHCAAVVLAHFGHVDTYMRLRATFNKNTFPGTEMPSFEVYSPGGICPRLGSSCSRLAYWLQVRGTTCPESGWHPKYKGSLSEASENAAYAAALEHNVRSSCPVEQSPRPPEPKEPARHNDGLTDALKLSSVAVDDILIEQNLVGDCDGFQHQLQQLQREEVAGEQALRASLEAGLSEIGTGQLPEMMGGLSPLGMNDADFDPFGVDFDLSQHDAENNAVTINGHNGSTSPLAAPPVSASTGLLPQQGVAGGMGIPPGLMTGKGFGSGFGGGHNGVAMITGGEELSRDPSFGISGFGATSAMTITPMSSVPPVGGGALVRQSSLDMYTILQMASSDEELKQNGGGKPDAIDNALAFGDGPAKELFGIDLSNL